MIITVIDLLKADNFYKVSENIDIAKGKNYLPTTFKEIKNALKRNNRYGN